MPVAKPQAMLADKGYDGDDVRASLLMKGILPVIPPKANRKQPIACDFQSVTKIATGSDACSTGSNSSAESPRVTTRPQNPISDSYASLPPRLWNSHFVNRT